MSTKDLRLSKDLILHHLSFEDEKVHFSIKDFISLGHVSD